MSALRTLGFHSSSLAPVKSFIDKHLTNHTCTTCRGYSRLDNTNKYALITPAFGFKLHGKSNKNDQIVISDLTTFKRTRGTVGVSILRHVDIQLDCYHNVTNVPKTVHVGIDGDGLVDKLHIDGNSEPIGKKKLALTPIVPGVTDFCTWGVKGQSWNNYGNLQVTGGWDSAHHCVRCEDNEAWTTFDALQETAALYCAPTGQLVECAYNMINATRLRCAWHGVWPGVINNKCCVDSDWNCQNC